MEHCAVPVVSVTPVQVSVLLLFKEKVTGSPWTGPKLSASTPDTTVESE